MHWRAILFIALLARVSLAAPPDFDSQVAPVLATHCLDCHSGAEPKGGLDLSSAAGARKGGENGAVLVAGDETKSALWERVASDEMPPKKPLNEAEKGVLRAWIAGGARWGTDPIDPYQSTTSVRAGYDWWSLQPLRAQAAGDEPVGDNHIDRFVREKLEAKSLAMSPPADRRTLLRRLSFDLIGLPPSPEEVDAFLRDDSVDAYAKVVERLLDSPHYGERWARHWLDVAHFGESDGFEFDRMRPNAWRYRDWVIGALNQDLPYDEFVRLQIAGDVLRPDDPSAITAAGFLVHGAHDALMPAGDAMRQMMRQDELEDVVGLVSQTFLGLTVHCARCHDHKFDPIRAEDYYRLASSLAGVRRGDRSLPAGPVPEELPAKLALLREELESLEDLARAKVLALRGTPDQPALPRPLLQFDFDDKDAGLKLQGTAKIEEGSFIVDGKRAYAASAPISKEIREKTLEAWVQLDNLEQRGGGVMSLQTLDGSVFDAIVFGEREPARWIAGSDNFKRTRDFEGTKETSAKEEMIHLAIVYSIDGTITAYRNGEPYGRSYKSEGPVAFRAGESQVVLGMRHGPAGGNKMLAGRIGRAALYDWALSAEEITRSASTGSVITRRQMLAVMSDGERSRHELLSAESDALDKQLAQLKNPQAYTLTPQQPENPTHMLLRGDPLQKGDIIAPGGLAGLKVLSVSFDLEPTAPEGERRKKLAQWITRADNPLFARTIANRVWHYHFGRGLVETPSDLGFNGGLPSHPELLDYLASELIANRWSLKHLHRLILTSATYQQGSFPRPECLAVDQDNQLLWRYRPHRLEAEAVRDAVLSIAGELNLQQGGPSFLDLRPYINHNSQYYEPIDPIGPEFNRRSIYRLWARGGKSPLLDTLDCPDPSTTTPKRGSTTTPLQALALLNNSFMLRMADSMAARIVHESGEGAGDQVDRAFTLAYSRGPSEQERKVSVAFVKQHGLPAFCRVLLNTNGFLYVD